MIHPTMDPVTARLRVWAAKLRDEGDSHAAALCCLIDVKDRMSPILLKSAIEDSIALIVGKIVLTGQFP